MKKSRIKSLAGLALACLALTGASTFGATTFMISSFDSDLSTLPWVTNVWPYLHDTPEPTAVTWTNFGNPAGCMAVDLDWALVTPDAWQDAKCQVQPWGTNGAAATDPIVDLSKFDFFEFDAAVDQANSQTNDLGSYGGIQCIVQSFWGMGNNPSNIVTGYQLLQNITLPTTTGWTHYQMPVASWPWAVSVITLNFHMQNNQVRPIHVKALIDNVKFTSVGKPPTMAYIKATRGLNIFQSANQYERNSIQTLPGYTVSWNSGFATTYSFTVAQFPTEAARSNYVVRMMIFPVPTSDVSPDWGLPDCVTMELSADTNGFASWMFRFKTNAPNNNGNLYNADSQIVITNPTPVGKWTLAFDVAGTGVTMTAPSGNSTNFTMGVHTNIPDIHGNFIDSGGEVYLGSYASGTNHEQVDLITVFSQAYISGLGVSIVSNNWTVNTTLTNNIPPSSTSVWLPVGSMKYTIVPTTNCMWLNWSVPDGGFALETNTLNAHFPLNWSTNHGLVPATGYWNHKGTLIKPGDLPSTPRLFFRMNSNPTQ
ncbi:MAG TPA: hypothetical protein VFD66_12930 [Verrucomicrobiae bacterium]|nr:hypothetical protein [Verrucomicrobiae bacterium]